MPYKSGEIPSGTEKVPAHGQAIYRAAFNSAHAGGASEESAHAIAWAAVKRKYKKRGDEWVSKDGASVMSAMGDKEFSTEQRKNLAKEGKAMSGGGYPIENEGDLRRAIQAFGRAKNKAATKAWIKKRARALGKTELLPENWDAMTQDGEIPFPEMSAAIFDEVRDAWMATADARRDDDVRLVGLDSSSVELTDSFVMDGVRRTKDGYLVADARIARTGVQLYSGHEVGVPDIKAVRVYRPEEEVFNKDSMKSLAHRPITLNHPPAMVDSDNWKDYSVGHTGGDVTRDGDCVRVPMVIMDAKAIESYEKHGVKELSVGYSTDLKWGRGKTPDGETYDAKQTAIRGNHLAVVPAARGGSRLCIGDDNEKGKSEMVKVLIDGQTIEFVDELAAKYVQTHIASLLKQVADAKAKKDDDDDDDDEEEEEKKIRAEKDAAVGEILALKKQLEDANAKLSGKALDAIVKERTELLLKADAAMEGKATFDGKEPAEIRRAVVEAKLGDAARGLSDDEVAGAFKALTAGLKPRTGVDRLADNLSMLNVGGGNANDSKAIRDAAYEQRIKDLNNAWRAQ